MRGGLSVAVLIALTAIVPLSLSAAAQNSSGVIQNEKDARAAEASARTAADHSRLAAYYHSKADEAAKNLAYAEDMEKQWSWMAGRKVPNAYTQAVTLADRYSDDWQKYTKLAANHERIAKSLETAEAAGR